MPELKNEIPSEEELYIYFREHFKEDSHPDWLPVAEAHRLGCDKLVEKMGESIFASLLRLNQFPRTNVFWKNTNRRPTIFKLREFCNLILRENPTDELALWTLASLDVHWWVNGFGKEYWKQIHFRGNFDVTWAVYAGLFFQANVGGGDNDMVELLLALDAKEESMPLLRACRESAVESISEWGKNVITSLNQIK
jgi:hypothetical protein